MTARDPELLLHAGPYLKRDVSTPKLMGDVIIALVPVMGAALWFFGVSALMVVGAATLGAVITEWGFAPESPRGKSLKDGSAILTGIILGLTLPPGVPLWIAFMGGVIGIGLGKLVWGGLGHNLFNPALVGRAFLQAAFPTVLTTWSPQGGPAEFAVVRGTNLALPLMQGDVDAITTATPLAMAKFQNEMTPISSLFTGNIGGCLGETSSGILILCGIFLIARRACDWRIPVSIVLSVAVFSGILFVASPTNYPAPWFMVLAGGLLFGAVFMATDPVTSPLAPKGAWIFGAGVGLLVVLIRLFGGLPEGVMYAILLMNAATPLLEQSDQPRVFGRGRKAA